MEIGVFQGRPITEYNDPFAMGLTSLKVLPQTCVSKGHTVLPFLKTISICLMACSMFNKGHLFVNVKHAHSANQLKNK